MKTLVTFALPFLVVLIAASFQQAKITRPVTAVTLVEREASGGRQADRQIAVRGDGAVAVRSLRTGKDNTGTEARNITLPKQRIYVVIADAIQTVSTFYMDPNGLKDSSHVTLSPRCEGRPDYALAGEETVLGFQTYRYQTTVLPGAAGKRESAWLAPALDCRVLRFRSESVAPDGRVTGSFDSQVINVILGEPDPSLFELPNGYREAPPSVASRALRELRTKRAFNDDPRRDALARGMERMDRKYFEAQQYRPSK